MGVDPKQQNAELIRIIGRNKERLNRSQKVLQDLTGRMGLTDSDPRVITHRASSDSSSANSRSGCARNFEQPSRRINSGCRRPDV